MWRGPNLLDRCPLLKGIEGQVVSEDLLKEWLSLEHWSQETHIPGGRPAPPALWEGWEQFRPCPWGCWGCAVGRSLEHP